MAMPNNAKIFPRGYSGGQSRSIMTHETRVGDVHINELWDQYTAVVNASETWGFRKKVFPHAIRLLSSKINWFVEQDHNPYVHHYNYEFILDTLRYIGTGHRRIPITSWGDLVAQNPTIDRRSISERRDVAQLFKKMALDTSPKALIQMWCSHRGGFDDMMRTLNILFGDLYIRSTDKVDK